MVLSVSVNPETEARLRELAEAAGVDVSSYVVRMITEGAAKRSLDEELAPLRRQFAESGTTDEQLVSEITEAQSEYRSDMRKRSA
jgi:hypothetical protein